jgi:hypothetical protein
MLRYWRLLRFMWAMRPVLREVEGMKGLKFSVNAVIQVVGVIGHAAAQLSDVLPPEGKFWASVVLAAAQGVAGVLAHFVNPDGSPATLPYHKGGYNGKR